MPGAVPAPLRDTEVGLPEALCTIDKLADFSPVLAGVNVTLIVQLAFGASEIVQVFVRENWVLSLPVTDTPLTTRFAVPVLVTVTACTPLVVLIS